VAALYHRPVERDEALRAACFLALDALRARLGDELPYKDGLDVGFAYDGVRIPFLSTAKGIHRAARQRGRAALSIQTSSKNPYGDIETDAGFEYAYRSGSVDQADNVALREAHLLRVPLVYFVGIRPGVYRPEYPWYVEQDDQYARRVLLSPGTMRQGEPARPADDIERRYLTREARVRLHQRRFRGLVLTAYRDCCAVCRLHEPRLLDASHIVADRDPAGVAAVRNGLAFCSIHHRAFDQNLVGVSPDYEVRIAPRLLDDEDGPMLDLLKGFHGGAIELPRSTASRPAREFLAERFEQFTAA
jgi:putative restriction endonuclease